MLTFITHLRVAPANRDALEALLAHVAERSREEAGVVHYAFARDVGDAARLVVIEVYRDADAQAAHMAQPWVRDTLPDAAQLVEGGFDIRQYVGPGTAPVPSRMEATPMMTDLERLIELQAIRDLKGRRDHAVDRKDWDTYAALHTDDYVAMSIGTQPIVGGRAAADALAVQMAGITTVHHCHTPVIAFQDAHNATGVWAMEDNLIWSRHGERQWLRGYGFYHETYVKGADGQWRFSYRKLERTYAETSPGAASLAHDTSGENLLVGTV